MHTHLLLAITTLSFAGSHGFYSQSSRHSQPPICRLPSKPCRLQVNINFLNGTLDSEMSTHTCTCSAPNSCSDDWSLSTHVISRNLLSTTHSITMNMMFCQAVQPQRQCNIGEEALVVSGSLTIPYNVVSFNCRCSDSSPLLLKERTMGTDYLNYHHYVCNSHMPTCPRSQSYCLSLLSDGIRYNCKCPNDRHCRVAETYPDFSGHGLCQD